MAWLSMMRDGELTATREPANIKVIHPGYCSADQMIG
jgi:hypothetical protein